MDTVPTENPLSREISRTVTIDDVPLVRGTLQKHILHSANKRNHNQPRSVRIPLGSGDHLSTTIIRIECAVLFCYFFEPHDIAETLRFDRTVHDSHYQPDHTRLQCSPT